MSALFVAVWAVFFSITLLAVALAGTLLLLLAFRLLLAFTFLIAGYFVLPALFLVWHADSPISPSFSRAKEKQGGSDTVPKASGNGMLNAMFCKWNGLALFGLRG